MLILVVGILLLRSVSKHFELLLFQQPYFPEIFIEGNSFSIGNHFYCDIIQAGQTAERIAPLCARQEEELFGIFIFPGKRWWILQVTRVTGSLTELAGTFALLAILMLIRIS